MSKRERMENIKNNQTKIDDFMKYARSKGYSNDKIKQMFRDRGWKDEAINKILNQKPIVDKKETTIIQKKIIENNYIIKEPPAFFIDVKEVSSKNGKLGFIIKKLRFPLIWTIFFSIIGIIIQSIQADKFIFWKFFSGNYYNWIISFGVFAKPLVFNSAESFLNILISNWYYFFFTGGIISLIWAILAILFSIEE